MSGMDSAMICDMPLWKCRVQVLRGHTNAPVGCLHRGYGARIAEASEANGHGKELASRRAYYDVMRFIMEIGDKSIKIIISAQISKKRKFVAGGVFYAESNEFSQRTFAEDGCAGFEVRVRPIHTETNIRAALAKEVLDEKGRRTSELTAVTQNRYGFPENAVKFFMEQVERCTSRAMTQCDSPRYKLLGGLASRRACYDFTRFIMENGDKGIEVIISAQISEKFRFVADDVFYAESNEFSHRTLAEGGNAGFEVRVTPIRTESMIRATRARGVLGEKGSRIRKLTAVVQECYSLPENFERLFAEHVEDRAICALAQCESLRYKWLGDLAARRACYGVLHLIMENGAKGIDVIIGGKLHAQHTKAMKFRQAYLIYTGEPWLTQNPCYLFVPGKLLTTKAGTPCHVVPQMLSGKYDQNTHLWSEVVIMYVVCCGQPPFFGENGAKALSKGQRMDDILLQLDRLAQSGLSTQRSKNA